MIIDNQANFQEKYQNLKKFLDFLSTEEQKKTTEINLVKTDELKEKAEKKLFNLKKLNKELKEKLADFEQLRLAKEQEIERKIKVLEELKNNVKLKWEDKQLLNDLLEAQEELAKSDNDCVAKQLKKSKNKLSDKLTGEELDELFQF